jgi:hypothetical protein
MHGHMNVSFSKRSFITSFGSLNLNQDIFSLQFGLDYYV